jgi:putative ubiquitin-RnfH superfamily antitoxin RatB of RatAB toxin-antitoxin module
VNQVIVDEILEAEPLVEHKPDQIGILAALNVLQRRGKVQIYSGTADPEVVRKRRAKNKRARASRKLNRT